MEELEYKIWYSKLKIKNRTKINLIKLYGNCKKIWNLDKKKIELLKINEEEKNELLNPIRKLDLEKEKNNIQNKQVKIINCYDNEYPKKLLEINNYPVQIYVRGKMEKLGNYCIGMVGSRLASNYGKKIARKIAFDFSQNGITVVSGLAVGIDKFSHLGALDGKIGNTIAVLGNGLDESVFYPFENLKIYERIIEEGGTIISEYPMFQKSCAENFPKRNRIISGLSEKIIVVEAKKKSGSLITVDYALEQGKDVYAVPRKYR